MTERPTISREEFDFLPAAEQEAYRESIRAKIRVIQARGKRLDEQMIPASELLPQLRAESARDEALLRESKEEYGRAMEELSRNEMQAASEVAGMLESPVEDDNESAQPEGVTQAGGERYFSLEPELEWPAMWKGKAPSFGEVYNRNWGPLYAEEKLDLYQRRTLENIASARELLNEIMYEYAYLPANRIGTAEEYGQMCRDAMSIYDGTRADIYALRQSADAFKRVRSQDELSAGLMADMEQMREESHAILAHVARAREISVRQLAVPTEVLAGGVPKFETITYINGGDEGDGPEALKKREDEVIDRYNGIVDHMPAIAEAFWAAQGRQRKLFASWSKSALEGRENKMEELKKQEKQSLVAINAQLDTARNPHSTPTTGDKAVVLDKLDRTINRLIQELAAA
jgi:hypothetical protein